MAMRSMSAPRALVCGVPPAAMWRSSGTGGRLHWPRARRKVSVQGHSKGVNVGVSERLTRRPGTAKNRARTVRATVKCSLAEILPSVAVQRMRSWR